jgi:anti-sigma B factor antagonist
VSDLLSIVSVPIDGGIIVRVSGELDVATEPELSANLAGLNDTRIMLDMSKVSFIDSCGFRALVRAHNRSEHDGGGLVVSGVAPTPLKAMRVLGLDKVLHLTE